MGEFFQINLLGEIRKLGILAWKLQVTSGTPWSFRKCIVMPLYHLFGGFYKRKLRGVFWSSNKEYFNMCENCSALLNLMVFFAHSCSYHILLLSVSSLCIDMIPWKAILCWVIGVQIVGQILCHRLTLEAQSFPHAQSEIDFSSERTKSVS